MDIEQRIKEIEKIANFEDMGFSQEKENTAARVNAFYRGVEHGEITIAKKSLEVINYLQSEVERYKSLYETNSAAEFKDEVIQLNKEGKYTIKFEGCFPKPPKQNH